MKKIYIILIVFISLCSCEEVIVVDLHTENPRLVVDAFIKWQKGTDGKKQSIRLSKTTDYYTNTIPSVTGAIVTVTKKAKETDEIDKTFVFAEDLENPIEGTYVCLDFEPKIGYTYILEIETKEGVSYTAEEKMTPVPPIDMVKLNTENTGMGMGDDRIIYDVYFTDPANQANFYWLKILTDTKRTGFTQDDPLFNGNQFYFTRPFSKKDDEGKVHDIGLIGLSESYYHYVSMIISLAGSGGGSPFGTPPATVRGNIINKTNEADYALGFFSLSEMDVKTITVGQEPQDSL